MSGTRAISTTSRRELWIYFFPARQGPEGNSRHSDRKISLFPFLSGQGLISTPVRGSVGPTDGMGILEKIKMLEIEQRFLRRPACNFSSNHEIWVWRSRPCVKSPFLIIDVLSQNLKKKGFVPHRHYHNERESRGRLKAFTWRQFFDSQEVRLRWYIRMKTQKLNLMCGW